MPCVQPRAVPGPDRQRRAARVAAVVHTPRGLERLVAGQAAYLQLPVMLQQYVDHGGCLFKVYVLGDVSGELARATHAHALPHSPPACVLPLPVPTLPRMHCKDRASVGRAGARRAAAWLAASRPV